MDLRWRCRPAGVPGHRAWWPSHRWAPSHDRWCPVRGCRDGVIPAAHRGMWLETADGAGDRASRRAPQSSACCGTTPRASGCDRLRLGPAGCCSDTQRRLLPRVSRVDDGRGYSLIAVKGPVPGVCYYPKPCRAPGRCPCSVVISIWIHRPVAPGAVTRALPLRACASEPRPWRQRSSASLALCTVTGSIKGAQDGTCMEVFRCTC